MDDVVKAYLRKIGSVGGKRSRRVLPSETARQMVRIREARRAFQKFKVSCFWSFDPNMIIRSEDIPWVIAQLRKNGDRTAWAAAERLCH